MQFFYYKLLSKICGTYFTKSIIQIIQICTSLAFFQTINYFRLIYIIIIITQGWIIILSVLSYLNIIFIIIFIIFLIITLIFYFTIASILIPI